MARLILLVLFPLALSGCYYVQAAKGQWELTRKREPIAEVIAREDTPPALAARLRLLVWELLVEAAAQVDDTTRAEPDDLVQAATAYFQTRLDEKIRLGVIAPGERQGGKDEKDQAGHSGTMTRCRFIS